MSKKQSVLVVGGGFAGVKAALELADDERIKVTLLSDSPYLRYYPTLYHTATGGQRANSSIPLKTIFADKSVTLEQGTASALDRKAKTVSTKEGETFRYDTLIMALGVVTNYFGIPGLKEYSYSIKSQYEVQRFKAHLHQQITDDRRPDLHYVIVGAGPTGIELAGALPAYLKRIMKNHGIKRRAIHVDLIEAMPRLLPRLPKDISRAVRRRLKHLGIRLYLGSAVQGQSADELTVNGKPIRSHTVVWTAGVTNHPLFSENHFVITAHGKVATDIYLQAEPGIFVLGDNANTPYSGMAQTALNDGLFVAKNLIRKANGKDFKSYVAKRPITVVPAGPRWAAVIWGKLHLYGWLGWLLREAADWDGFHEFESLPQATRQFLTEFTIDDDCLACTAAEIR